MENTGLAVAYTVGVSAIFGVFLISAVTARVVHNLYRRITKSRY